MHTVSLTTSFVWDQPNVYAVDGPLRTRLVSRARATFRLHSSVGTVGMGVGDVAVTAIGLQLRER